MIGEKLLEWIDAQIGRGVLIDKRAAEEWEDAGCPFCGARWHIAYLDDDWSGNQSSPDDVFECAGCGATSTRRDAFGLFEIGYWDKDKNEQRSPTRGYLSAAIPSMRGLPS